MKNLGAGVTPTIESTDVLVVDVENGTDNIQVYRDKDSVYHIVRSGVVRHPNCSADDAMRALGQYLQSALYKATSLSQTSSTGRKMKTPADDGPIKGEAVAARMMDICGCKGQYDCDCVSVENRARIELWTEHNTRTQPMSLSIQR